MDNWVNTFFEGGTNWLDGAHWNAIAIEFGYAIEASAASQEDATEPSRLMGRSRTF